MTSNSVTQEQLKSLLSYNTKTGEFTSIKAVGHNGNWKAGRKVGYLDRSNGYIKISLLGKKHYAHRLAWLYVYGHLPKEKIDHINHDRMDNRLSNLRVVSDLESARNCSKCKSNTSGFTGVTWDKNLSKWVVRIMVNRKNLHIGVFEDIEIAKIARKEAEKEYGFHKNHGV